MSSDPDDSHVGRVGCLHVPVVQRSPVYVANQLVESVAAQTDKLSDYLEDNIAAQIVAAGSCP